MLKKASIALRLFVELGMKSEKTAVTASAHQGGVKCRVIARPLFLAGLAPEPMLGRQDIRFPIDISEGDGATERQRLDLATQVGEISEVGERQGRHYEAALIPRDDEFFRHQP